MSDDQPQAPHEAPPGDGAAESQTGAEPSSETQPPAAAVRREPRSRSFQPGLWGRLIPIGVVAVYTVAFIVLNTKQTKISFVFASTRVSLIFLILVALGIGIVLGILVSQLHRHRQRRR